MNFSRLKKDDYDVAIIGSGIGGLICGCYLAKTGMKVLITEQHSQPGGYCTSFNRNGFVFDAGVHYLGSLRSNGGMLFNILRELGLLDRLDLLKSERYEEIIMPQETVSFGNSKIEEGLAKYFPRDKEGIFEFFRFVRKSDFLRLFSRTRNKTFTQLLNTFIRNKRLQAILSVPIGNLGIPASRASALAALALYREYILDGGYYPKGGIQQFPNLLATKFCELGGTLLLSNKVMKIDLKNNKVRGIYLQKGGLIKAKFIVSNADARQTFLELINDYSPEQSRIPKIKISPSAFVVYLGINRKLNGAIGKSLSTWIFSNYDVDSDFDTKNYHNLKYLICHFPTSLDSSLAPAGKSTVRVMIWVPAGSGDFTEKTRAELEKKIIYKLSKFIGNISNNIEVKMTATPSTFRQYTLNDRGSAFGWYASVRQTERDFFPLRTGIDGLYLVGHWVTSGIGHSGIPMVSFCGKNVAENILKQR